MTMEKKLVRNVAAIEKLNAIAQEEFGKSLQMMIVLLAEVAEKLLVLVAMVAVRFM